MWEKTKRRGRGTSVFQFAFPTPAPYIPVGSSIQKPKRSNFSPTPFFSFHLLYLKAFSQLQFITPIPSPATGKPSQDEEKPSQLALSKIPFPIFSPSCSPAFSRTTLVRLRWFILRLPQRRIFPFPDCPTGVVFSQNCGDQAFCAPTRGNFISCLAFPSSNFGSSVKVPQ